MIALGFAWLLLMVGWPQWLSRSSRTVDALDYWAALVVAGSWLLGSIALGLLGEPVWGIGAALAALSSAFAAHRIWRRLPAGEAHHHA